MSDGPVATGEWECMECGYIAAGVRTRKPQACPDCGAPGQALEFFPYEDEEDEPQPLDDEDELYEDVDPDGDDDSAYQRTTK